MEINQPPGSGTKQTSTLAALFPHAKFVFPTAPRGRATVYKRSIINQWFDGWHVDDSPDKKTWMMVDGLQRTVDFLHGLLRREAALVGGARNIVLGGLSQGCAASLVAGMLWSGEEERLGAIVGMCGWLPFMGVMKEALASREGGSEASDEFGEPDFDPFERSDTDIASGPSADDAHGPGGKASWRETRLAVYPRAVLALREELELPQPAILDELLGIAATPVFLGHGVDDNRVPASLGRESGRFLGSLGVPISWHEYTDLGHWYSAAMLADLVHFLQSQAKLGQR